MTCSPTGRPERVNPQGTDAAGWRDRLNGQVIGDQSNHSWKRASGTSIPAVKGAIGMVGVTRRSTS